MRSGAKSPQVESSLAMAPTIGGLVLSGASVLYVSQNCLSGTCALASVLDHTVCRVRERAVFRIVTL